MICKSVDLPQPFGPTIPTVVPASISKETSRSAQNSLWRRRRPRVRDSLRRSPGRWYMRYCLDTLSTRNAVVMSSNVAELRRSKPEDEVTGTVGGQLSHLVLCALYLVLCSWSFIIAFKWS